MATSQVTQAKDVDSSKDLMARFVYSIKLPSAGIGIDLGPNIYLVPIFQKPTNILRTAMELSIV